LAARRAHCVSQGEGDVSHDGLHIVTFRSRSNETVLVILSRDGSRVERMKQLPSNSTFRSPRWSPDDQWIAFDGSRDSAFDHKLFVMNVGDGEPKPVASATNIQGVAWLPNGSGLIYASSAGSTMAYRPSLTSEPYRKTEARNASSPSATNPTWSRRRHGRQGVRQQGPDAIRYLAVPGGRIGEDNTRNGLAITHQTGQVQTPSVSPDGKEIVYLSDSGGHANLWVANLDVPAAPPDLF